MVPWCLCRPPANDPERLATLVEEAKALADKKKTIDDGDLAALASDGDLGTFGETWTLADSTYVSSVQLASNTSTCTATVQLNELSTGRSVVQARPSARLTRIARVARDTALNSLPHSVLRCLADVSC